MAQYNVERPDRPERDTGLGTVLAVLLVLALVAFLVWALAFGGFGAAVGGPQTGTTADRQTGVVGPADTSAPGAGTAGTPGQRETTKPATP